MTIPFNPGPERRAINVFTSVDGTWQEPVKINDLVGVMTVDSSAGVSPTGIYLDGVFVFNTTSGDSYSIGSNAYWNSSSKQITTSVTDFPIGPVTQIDTDNNKVAVLLDRSFATSQNSSQLNRVFVSTSTYAVQPQDDVIFVNASAQNVIVSALPSSSAPAKQVKIIKTDSSINTVDYTAASGDNVNGQPSGQLTAQFESHDYFPNGIVTWYLV